MKVMHILDSLNRGGAEVLALDVCRNGRASGLDLTFVATGGGDLEEEFRRSGAAYLRLQRRFPLDLHLVARLRQIIEERDIQVVHCHQAVEALHAYFATRGTKIRRVLSFHLCTADAKNRLALKFLIPRVHANIAVSRDLLCCLKSEAGLETSRNFHVVYNGVDAKRLQCATGGKIRAELNLSKNALLLGMVGNFYSGARKDQLTVCRALPRLFNAASDAHFLFIGGHLINDSQLYDACVNYCRQQNISNRVHFLGKRPDIPEILGSLDIFVFSSLQEGMPIAVIEAMMMGIPTVVSDISPLLEVSDNGTYALVFRTKDSDDLAEKLANIINDPTCRAQLGAKAKQWAISQFSIEAHISDLVNLYKDLCKA